MRIALVILQGDPARGGAERYTADLAAALRGRGHEVALIASAFPPGELPAGAVALRSRLPTRVGRYLSFARQLRRHLAQARYDVVHAMLPVPHCDVYHPHAGVAAQALGHGLRNRLKLLANPRRWAMGRAERRLLNSPQPPIVLCLSEYLKKELTGFYPLPSQRMATLFNAIDLAKFDPAARSDAGLAVRQRFGIGPGKVVALMIAQDFARKGLLETILALALTGDRRLQLLVVGKENHAWYREIARQSGVSSQVVFAGTTTDPYAFYRAADLFVLPTRHDPCSLVVLEALAMGLPVISTAFNGACEIMSDGVHGFVLPRPDASAVSCALKHLLDADRRRQMSQACLASRPALAYERHLDRLIEIYENAMHRDQRGR